MNFFKSIFLTLRFFLALGACAILFILAFFFPVLLPFATIAIALLALLTLFDFVALYSRKGIEGKRSTSKKLSNGDDNNIFIYLKNKFPFKVFIRLIDEIPHQFQKRDFDIKAELLPNTESTLKYQLKPVKRGEYVFGALNIFTSSPLRLVERRFRYDQDAMVPVYPSFLQMRKYELLAISNRLKEYGIKKIRRIGQSQEFEQIREYVTGDNYRDINWKATARKQSLMVNQFTDERSQRVYCILDKGRLMKSPFDGMTLLDYAINSSLVISNIVLKHHNKPGLITFGKAVQDILPANNKSDQLIRIMELLYAQQTNFEESSYANLYGALKHKVRQRSLLLLFANFQTMSHLNRHIKYLRQIAKKHLLVCVVFRNTEIDELLESSPENTHQVFIKTIGQKFSYEKRLIIKELKKHGIHTIYTSPKELSANTINKYLELRARGLIN